MRINLATPKKKKKSTETAQSISNINDPWNSKFIFS